jgi:hypothetical protein
MLYISPGRRIRRAATVDRRGGFHVAAEATEAAAASSLVSEVFAILVEPWTSSVRPMPGVRGDAHIFSLSLG